MPLHRVRKKEEAKRKKNNVNFINQNYHFN